MGKETRHLLVLTTCPGSISAKKISRDLVAEKLAACVNVVPGVQSWFRWINKVEHENEHLLVIKTTTEAYQSLEKRIKSQHPYELPEIVAVPIHTGLADYLEWISTNTKNETD